MVFLDADTLVVDEVLEEDFISDKSLFGVWHPCHNLGMPPHNKLPGAFETNPLSLACVDTEKELPTVYYQGCLWGGKVPYIFDMIRKIDEWTKEDIAKNIQARFYEESYMNKWFLTHRDDTQTLAPDYAFPEMFEQYCNFSKKMVHLAKDNKALDNNQW